LTSVAADAAVDAIAETMAAAVAMANAHDADVRISVASE
jgi:hypothetical protein